ncbi:hypothetical protein [Hymenobacter antarcticus]|uniref:Lipoprotein n=1 Tax=Hymenobacter antarcticus TaxID=486270 RepID=A0ABP7QYW5_9BACT
MVNPFSLPSPFAAVLLVASGLLLSGCCANDVCDCNDADADAVELRFASSFSNTGLNTDLDTVVIQRFAVPLPTGGKPDVVTLIRTAARSRDSIRLNNGTPFPQISTTRLDGYRYVLQYYVTRPGNKPVLTTLLNISEIKLEGSIDGNGCCTCYNNSKKTVFTRRDGFSQDSAFDLKQAPRVLKVTK